MTVVVFLTRHDRSLSAAQALHGVWPLNEQLHAAAEPLEEKKTERRRLRMVGQVLMVGSVAA